MSNQDLSALPNPPSPDPATVPITALLPHRGTMLRLDTLTFCGDGVAEGRFLVRADDPFVEDGQLPHEILIESAAQTVAASQGWKAYQQNQPIPQGMLIGVEAFQCYHPIPTNQLLLIHTRREIQKAELLITHCSIHTETLLIAEGLLKFYVSSSL